MTVAEAAKYANCHTTTIRKLIVTGKLRGEKRPSPYKKDMEVWEILDDKTRVRDVVNHEAPRHGYASKKTTNGAAPSTEVSVHLDKAVIARTSVASLPSIPVPTKLSPSPVLEMVLTFKALPDSKRALLRKLMDRSEAELLMLLELLEEV